MIAEKMKGACLTGHGSIEKIVYRDDLTVPTPMTGEVLVKVTATAKNNTDRKVREGLYPTENEHDISSFQISGTPSLSFPRIQGADIVGRIVAVGSDVPVDRINERGLLDFNIYLDGRRDINLTPDYYGHGRDGGFAEYVAVPADQFYRIDNPDLADAELAALGMCSYQTAYHMMTVTHIKRGEHVLITGASGGVGTALIQLCRIIGAIPHAVTSPGKGQALLDLGAESIIDRSQVTNWITSVRKATGGKIIDAVMDLVGGETTNKLIDVLTERMADRTTYPRLSIAGASNGNTTKILWTKIYLYQIQIFGVSHGTREEVDQLIVWIRNGDLRPVLHGTFRLSDIHKAESYFVNRNKGYIGKIAIVPDDEWQEHGQQFAIETEL